MPDGFEIEFTSPVNKQTAENVNNYDVSSYTYKYHPVYGSPLVNRKDNAVRGAKATEDGMKVRIVLDGMREGYVHDIKPEGVRSAKDNFPLLHGSAYYTLNNIPKGEKANIALVTPKTREEKERVDSGANANTPDNQMKEAMPTTAGVAGATKGKSNIKKITITPSAMKVAIITDAEATKLLTKHTCLACHKVGERAVGPSYKEVAKRNYTNEQIEALIYEPKPENWPEFTPMAPMTHVPKGDVKKIAAWINSLEGK